MLPSVVAGVKLNSPEVQRLMTGKISFKLMGKKINHAIVNVLEYHIQQNKLTENF